ncbi:MAG: LysM domain-containing protein [Planctomycetota bacterium]|nr:LysM domain-containing protein [Planctomycetota bacterium]
MKQNERLLVYAVTGFLALILVVAIFFGDTPSPAESARESGGTSLSDILNAEQEPAQSASARDAAAKSTTGLSGPVAATFEQPLRVQAPSPATLVRQKLGAYSKERSDRRVTVKANDGWGVLAQRWLGDSSRAEDIQCLNEDTQVLREGQTVLVEWVDDEVLLEGLAASETPTLLGADAPSPTASAGVPAPASSSLTGVLTPAIASRTDVADVAPAAAAAALVLYEIQAGDSLWKILDKRFETRQVPAMIERTKELNPGMDPGNLSVGKKIKLPKSAQ